MNILFIVYGTGGAEAINEIEKVIRGRDFYYKILACSDFSKSKIDSAIRVSEEQAIESIKEVDLVISERSNGIEFQKNITKKCKEKGILNLVITDIYLSGKSNYNNYFDILPDYITAISDLAYKELKNIGFKEEQIIKLGNPGYIRLYNIEYVVSFTKNPKILFTSQGGKGNKTHEELTSFLSSCTVEFDKVFEDYSIDVKLHPMEEDLRGEWKKTIVKNKWKCNLLDIPTNVDFLTDYITNYDLLIGLYSTLQVQGQLIGIPSIFEGGNIAECLDRYSSNIFPLMWDKELNYYKVSEIDIIKMFNKIKEGIR